MPGDPAATRPLLAVVTALAAGGAVSLGIELHGGEIPDRLSDVFTALGLAARLRARSSSGCARSRTPSRRRWRSAGSRATLVDAYGSDSLSFFALRRDKSYFFSPTRRVVPRVSRRRRRRARSAATRSATRNEFDALLAEFRRVARANGWRLAVIGASETHLDALPAARHARDRDRRGGGAASGDVLARGPPDPQGAPVGVAPDEGRATRCASSPPTRRTTRCARRSTTSRSSGAATSPSAASRWRSTTSTSPGTVFAVAEDEEGRVGGFLHLAPTPAGGGWSLSTMRRTPDRAERPHRVPHRRDARVGEGAGRSELSLNFCALTDLICPDRANTIPRRLLRRGAARRRQRLPARAPLLVQPQVLPRVAAALPVRRAAERPAARRSRLPPRRAAARAARPVGEAGPQSRVTLTGMAAAGDAQPRTPVGDRTGDGPPRLRVLPRGAQADRSAARPVGGGAARRGRDAASAPRAASICASCSTSSARRS